MSTPLTPIRRAAITAGAALALMAVLAPIANFGLIPAGETGPAAMRILYAAAFAVAIAQLAAGNTDAFQAIWDAALAVFGLHLLVVATLFVRGCAPPSWVGILVALAGVGYLVDDALVAGNGEAAIGQFTFVGEVVLLVWLLGWGGAQRRPKTRSGRRREPATA